MDGMGNGEWGMGENGNGKKMEWRKLRREKRRQETAFCDMIDNYDNFFLVELRSFMTQTQCTPPGNKKLK